MNFYKNSEYVFTNKGKNVTENRTAVYDYFLPICYGEIKTEELNGEYGYNIINNTNTDLMLHIFLREREASYSNRILSKNSISGHFTFSLKDGDNIDNARFIISLPSMDDVPSTCFYFSKQNDPSTTMCIDRGKNNIYFDGSNFIALSSGSNDEPIVGIEKSVKSYESESQDGEPNGLFLEIGTIPYETYDTFEISNNYDYKEMTIYSDGGEITYMHISPDGSENSETISLNGDGQVVSIPGNGVITRIVGIPSDAFVRFGGDITLLHNAYGDPSIVVSKKFINNYPSTYPFNEIYTWNGQVSIANE